MNSVTTVGKSGRWYESNNFHQRRAASMALPISDASLPTLEFKTDPFHAVGIRVDTQTMHSSTWRTRSPGATGYPERGTAKGTSVINRANPIVSAGLASAQDRWPRLVPPRRVGCTKLAVRTALFAPFTQNMRASDRCYGAHFVGHKPSWGFDAIRATLANPNVDTYEAGGRFRQARCSIPIKKKDIKTSHKK